MVSSSRQKKREADEGYYMMHFSSRDTPKDTVGIDTVGIASLSYYIPTGILTSREMSQLSGIPLPVFLEKIGMEQKHIAAEDEHPSEMGIIAAEKAIRKVGINAEDIGIVAYCGAGPYDYRIWSPAARISAALGIVNSYAFEVKNGCNGGNLGLNICKNLLLGDPDKEYALVVCSEKLSPTIDYSDPNSLSLFMAADGAAAAILKKGEATNRLLSYSSLTDGSIVDSVKMPMGGTKIPYSPDCESRLGHICVDDPAGVDRILSQTYLTNYMKVVTTPRPKRRGFYGFLCQQIVIPI